MVNVCSHFFLNKKYFCGTGGIVPHDCFGCSMYYPKTVVCSENEINKWNELFTSVVKKDEAN